jgi:TonB family protein
MSQPLGQSSDPTPGDDGPTSGLRFLIRLEPRLPALCGNVGALLSPAPADSVLTTAPFWSDVFVGAGLPWRSLLESALSHGLMLAAVWGLSHAWLLRPRVVMRPVFQPSQIVYYTTSEYLPAIETPTPRARVARKPDPAYAPQEIISVPPEADNARQTIITPPDVKLAKEMALPNLVAWTPTPGPVPVPGSLESKLTLPAITTPVIPPPPQVTRTADRAASPLPQPAVIAPPPDIVRASDRVPLHLTQPSVIAPPPDVADAARRAGPALPQPQAVAPVPETTAALANLRAPHAPQPAVIPPPAATIGVSRPLGELNAADLQPRVAAPRLPLASQQTASALDSAARPGGNGGRPAPGAGGQPAGSPATQAAAAPNTQNVALGRPAGQMIALGVAPSAVSGPIEIPEGNRRGLFAAGPSGHVGASGRPAANSGGTAEAGTSSHGSNVDKLAGITIAPGASTPANTGVPVVAAAPAAHNLLALASIPSSIRNIPPREPADVAIAPSEIEREVFGNKRFYSVTLNMPNLNSRSGSWVIRFAELKQDPSHGNLTAPVMVEKVDPAYPGILMREHIEGTVTLYAVIGADGNVGDVRVLRGVNDRLDAAAREALRHCHFRPATKNGLAVALEAVIRIPFEIHRIPY